MSRPKLLVVDDEKLICQLVAQFFEPRGYDVVVRFDFQSADEAAHVEQPDVALVDYRMPGGTALDLLRRWREDKLPFPAIVLTGHGTIDLAVRAIREGAENFVTKPLSMESLAVVIERALANARDRRTGRATRSREQRGIVDPFTGTSPAILALAIEAQKVAQAGLPILVRGETGVGKGVLATWLHHNGPRRHEPLVEINCAGLSKELLESELFGHEKGAFTGAIRTKMGLLEVAHRGTVFLDEIGDLDLEVQPKLLKVLEDRRFRRVGDTRDRQVDVQLIAATHQDLNERVGHGLFRADLYFRLSTLPLVVPPLRSRGADIALLAHRFLDELASQLGRRRMTLSPAAEATLLRYGWPGNVRELRNVLERAVLLSDETVLDVRDLRFNEAFALPNQTSSHQTLQEVEVRHIERVLLEEGNRVAVAADRLGVPRSTLYQKIKKYGIVLSRS